MSTVEQRNAARAAILDAYANGPAMLVTVLRHPIDHLKQILRLERWRVEGDARTAVDGKMLFATADDLKTFAEPVALLLQDLILYAELSAEPV